eukprot:CAMPEP_0118952050 /NCGR_PEP_ID=MMETSP1169-20130426/54142_1 /TAXON_ID=36882 /ORGANISM="Pyramimonas obovata, Strain CCMP722" /LENGTH=210 /DNA_ID=CAMNT_0006899211 /DNA_START=246 /DNA_END=879 /DNA_ORIENTATION=+
MSNKGSYDFKKQYGRKECAFSVTMPECRGRPTKDHHCSRNSEGVTYVHNVMGVKARSLDSRMDRGTPAIPSPLNTSQPGQGWCPYNQQYVPSSSAGNTASTKVTLHNEGPVALGGKTGIKATLINIWEGTGPTCCGVRNLHCKGLHSPSQWLVVPKVSVPLQIKPLSQLSADASFWFVNSSFHLLKCETKRLDYKYDQLSIARMGSSVVV